MTNRTYNNIIMLLGFITALGFAILKFLDVIDKSWWMILIPIGLVVLFRTVDDDYYKYKDDDDNDDSPSNNNLKMA